MSNEWHQGVEECSECKRTWFVRMGNRYKDPVTGKVLVRLCKVCGRDPFYKKQKPIPDGEDLDEIFAILDEGIEETGLKAVKNPDGIKGGQVWVKDQ